ncbi:butyrophilin-like protein 2 [Sparus aurata]|uniref:butyrophilin-like protein 2 n=1 Tax=Sparus aurata TaxID=8175 RepID=UPI0011C1814A|nr:butyrophilin-like protein 2 [Sparus aurata]
MLPVTLRRSLNFQFGAFTVLVALIHSCGGQHHVSCPSEAIVATVGEDIVLPAYLEPATNALRKTIEWTRPDLSPRYVHVLRQGVKLTGNHPSYEGRTSLFSDELKLGNVSLKLSRVRISDEGPYRCFIPEMKISCIIQLVVEKSTKSELICSHQAIALVGEDVLLPCHLEPAVTANYETVVWTRPGLIPEYIHYHQDGRLLFEKQNPSYSLRTRLFMDELPHGNVSMKIFRVKISDAGRYFCNLPSMVKEAPVQLIVGAVSSPFIEVVTNNSEHVVLQCESTGWYPEPEVFWLDGEGNLLSAGPTETVRGPDDLYTVSSRVTVEKRHSNSFTCRVQQNHINQTRETHIHVPDDFFAGPSGSSSSLPVIIGLMLCIVFVLIAAAAVVVWKWRQTKSGTRSSARMKKEETVQN